MSCFVFIIFIIICCCTCFPFQFSCGLACLSTAGTDQLMLESVTPAEWQQYYVRAQLVQADPRQGCNRYQSVVDVVADEVN